MTTTIPSHDLWSVPVHGTPDGSLSMWCHDQAQAGGPSAGLTAWRGEYRAVVGGIRDDTLGAAAPDGDDMWFEAVDAEVARHHAATVAPLVAS